ncbi:MAG TPA: spore coat associated protein CotJA [Firmicutes bacterium]|nr:spore coat associated protein CotJA [Bacillota bacterium]
MVIPRKPDFMPKNPALAMAYVPMQPKGETYEPEVGLKSGTIFPDLNKPFYGRWND